MHTSVARITKVVALAALATLPFQGLAQAAIPADHAPGAPGHENHEVAYTGTYSSTVVHKYNSNKDKFKGTLKSNFLDPEGVLEHAEDADLVCVTGRKVSVYKKLKDGSSKLMGSDKTNDSGQWSVGASVSKGKYYASVAKSEMLIREYYNGIDFYATCKSATSPVAKL